ncbi:MAG: CPBP family intramembrane metalloprotease [Planctomycetes bacterium]|nr:CPBP family intramembrane metalloprotease [Planctomycetota bacterium]MCC7172608.1 CPBP family intramembrane metalloprotease [Planctomycetota bacterium]
MGPALRFAIGLYVALAVIGLAWMGWRGDDLGSILWGRSWTLALPAGLGFAVVVVLISDGILERFPWTRLLRREVRTAFHPITRKAALAIALLSGIGEELFFRGALQPAIGWVAASLVFGALHTSFDRQLIGWTLFATAVGLGLGALFEATGGLLAPILAHGAVNAVQLVRLATTRHPRVD